MMTEEKELAPASTTAPDSIVDRWILSRLSQALARVESGFT